MILVTADQMNVVNVKVAYIRPDYPNLKVWMEDQNNVYIGRKCIVFVDGTRIPRTDSLWANPKKVGGSDSREDVLIWYKRYILERLRTEDGLLDQLLQLEGKTLGCWCKPEACHGDILVELIRYYRDNGMLPAS
jgi:hypothetical protein